MGLSPEKTHSNPAPKSATGNRVFADLMSYIKMRSCWGRMGPQCNDWCPYKGNLDIQGEKCGDGGDIAVGRYKPRNTRDRQQPATRSVVRPRTDTPSETRGKPPANTLVRDSGQPECEKILFSLSPSSCCWVTALEQTWCMCGCDQRCWLLPVLRWVVPCVSVFLLCFL